MSSKVDMSRRIVSRCYRRPMKNRIRELRSQRGWSHADFAERLGVARQTVNTIETGKSVPSLSIALHIAWLFGTSIESVFPSDLEKKMRVLEATWAYPNVLATALTELRALEKKRPRRLGTDRIRRRVSPISPTRRRRASRAVGISSHRRAHDQSRDRNARSQGMVVLRKLVGRLPLF